MQVYVYIFQIFCYMATVAIIVKIVALTLIRIIKTNIIGVS